MRVVICPDKFAGTLSAVEAAEAIAAGWRTVAPDDELILRPIADGGPGFVEVLHAALGGELREVAITDPLGRPVTGQILIVGDTAYIESAQATGLDYLSKDERDPKLTSSLGVGTLISAAADAGINRVIIGLGGSATNDGGAGMLAALGIRALDPSGNQLPPGGAALTAATAIDQSAAVIERAGLAAKLSPTAPAKGPAPTLDEGARAGSAADEASEADQAVGIGDAGDPQPNLGDQKGFGSLKSGSGSTKIGALEIIGASDVDNPLIGEAGASAVYGPQKGATRQDVELLDGALANWARVLQNDLPGCPADLAQLKGGGAAGGLGAGILALGGRIVSGIDLIRELTGLDDALQGAGVVITGEGSFDHQSLRGKVIAGVAGAARDEGIPCVVLAGRVTTGRQEQGAAGVTEAHSLTDHFGSTEQAMSEPARGLRELAQRVAQQFAAGR